MCVCAHVRVVVKKCVSLFLGHLTRTRAEGGMCPNNFIHASGCVCSIPKRVIISTNSANTCFCSGVALRVDSWLPVHPSGPPPFS